MPDEVAAATLRFLDEGMLDSTELGRLIALWAAREPAAACRFVFQELPADAALKIIPELANAMSIWPDQVIADCFRSIKTQTELALAWRSVIDARRAAPGENGLALALLAPEASGIGSFFANRAIAGADSAAIKKLLDSGMPINWLLPRPRPGADPEPPSDGSALEVLGAAALYFGDTWPKSYLLRLLTALPEKDRQAALVKFFTGPEATRLRPADTDTVAYAVVSAGPEALKAVVNSLPDNYPGQAFRAQLQKRILRMPDEEAATRDALLNIAGPPDSSIVGINAKLADFDLKFAGSVVNPDRFGPVLAELVTSDLPKSSQLEALRSMAQLAGNERAFTLAAEATTSGDAPTVELMTDFARSLVPSTPEGRSVFEGKLKENEQKFLHRLLSN